MAYDPRPMGCSCQRGHEPTDSGGQGRREVACIHGAFPDTVSVCCGPLGDVLQLWQGMGYPRRARNLHRCAVAIVELGEFPEDLESLLALPVSVRTGAGCSRIRVWTRCWRA